MTTKKNKSRYGFILSELLVALAITGILIAAVAVAISASAKNYKENMDTFKTINNARQALARMTTQIRTATAVETTEPNNQCSLQTPNNDFITYRHDSDNNKLYLKDSGIDYLLCENVTALTFKKQISANDVKSVQISITIVCGNCEQTISAAAVVRRAL